MSARTVKNPHKRRRTTIMRDHVIATEKLLQAVDAKLLDDAGNTALLTERHKLAITLRDAVRLIALLQPQ